MLDLSLRAPPGIAEYLDAVILILTGDTLEDISVYWITLPLEPDVALRIPPLRVCWRRSGTESFRVTVVFLWPKRLPILSCPKIIPTIRILVGHVTIPETKDILADMNEYEIRAAGLCDYESVRL